MATEDKYNVKVLEKALNILRCFTSIKPEWTLVELSKELELNRSTVNRILNTLVFHGFVEISEQSRKYGLGSAFIVLGSTKLNQMDLRRIAGPHLQNLCEISRETTHLSFFSSMTAVIIDSYDSPQEVMVSHRVGKTSNLHTSSFGKIFLANLSGEELEKYIGNDLKRNTEYTKVSRDEIMDEVAKIRAEKVAFDLRESSDAISGVAAPVYNYKNEIIAAVSTMGPYARFEQNLDKITAEVKNTANNISKEMGYLGSY